MGPSSENSIKLPKHHNPISANMTAVTRVTAMKSKTVVKKFMGPHRLLAKTSNQTTAIELVTLPQGR